jgi:formylglycine-generating enzyme required for sulfatase activity
MLALHVPFPGKTPREVQHNVLFATAPPPKRFNPTVPRDLQVITLKAMERNPKDRYQNAREMAEDLRRFIRHDQIHAKPPGPATVATRFVARHRVAAIAAAAVLVAGVAGWIGYNDVQARATATQYLSGVELLVSEGNLREALDRLDAASPDLRAQAGFEDLLGRARQRNAEELAARTKSLAANASQESEGFTQSWFYATQDVAALERLRVDDPKILEQLKDYRGLHLVSVSCEIPNAEVYVEDVNPPTGATRDFRLLGKAPYRGRLPFGTYRFVVMTADGFGEYVRNVDREGLELNTTIRPTGDAVAGMVEIPAGEYPIGFNLPPLSPSNNKRVFNDQAFKKPTTVRLSAYQIDPKCVTNEEYEAYMRALGFPADVLPPATWPGGICTDDIKKKPVVVQWEPAQRYAEWRGKRLPTEDEWEAAGRGLEGRLFPWGNEPEDNRSNTRAMSSEFLILSLTPIDAVAYMTAVDAYPQGRTPNGLFDMVGNVVQWTWNPWLPRREASSDSASRMPSFRTVRGTSYESVMRLDRNLAARSGTAPNSVNIAGFRCAKSARPVVK